MQVQAADGAARVAPELQVGEGIGDGSSTRSDQIVISSRGAMMSPSDMRPALFGFRRSASRSPRQRTCSGTRGNHGQPVHPPAGALPADRERACARTDQSGAPGPGVTGDGLARSSRPACRRSGPCCGSNGGKRWPEPHGHGSSGPSLSISSVPEPTMRSPRLTRDSLGEPPAALAHRLKRTPRRRDRGP